MGGAFEFFGVVHLLRPAGFQAANLEDLRHGIAGAETASLFYHAVQCQLRSPAGDELPPDDFSAWVHGVVQDRETAERLSFAVQSGAGSPTALRAALLEVLDDRSPDARRGHAAPPAGEFVFLAVDSVPIPTGLAAEDADELAELLADVDVSVWFYHLIEQPWYTGGPLPPAQWLREREQTALAVWLEDAARSGRPLETMRRTVMARWRRSRLGRRLAESILEPEPQRREAGRRAVGRLVRRLKRADGRP